jgi:hypothetical protein
MIGLVMSLMIQLMILAFRLTIIAIQLMITGIVLLCGWIARSLEARR